MIRRYIFILMLMLAIGIPVVSAADPILQPRDVNDTLNTSGGIVLETSQFHTPAYVPDLYVWIAIIIGFACLVVSAFVPKEVNVFVLITPVFWGWAAWFSAYMVKDTVTTIAGGTAGTPYVVVTEIVYAQPVLQYAMIFLFLLSIIYAIYILFLQESEDEPEKPTGEAAWKD